MSKKQLIVDTSIELFAQNGIEATSVQHITEACGISKGAFYLHFKSKDELLLSIFDYFMKFILGKIDDFVNSSTAPKEKLHAFFLFNLSIFEEHASFAKVFIQEHMHSINQELFEKLKGYDNRLNHSLLQLLDQVYGDSIQETRYDLLVLMKGFLRAYSELILLQPMPHDFEKLSAMLVEKTDILAAHSKKAYVTEALLESESQLEVVTISAETVIEEIEDVQLHVTDPLELESLEILKEELVKEQPRKAVVTGLTHNISKQDRTEWLRYLLRQLRF
ncbi:TetR/AcrR family transcriptional regulator [Paenisporosarcina cavernae]|uniref:TetR/AcrR family transcriptional regulator n=1 Tax=Paenisporosarcina cavernae TaxID=2320858 RepID=A0A385YPR9_9BACL|nr:TetR/AcrR family transcriptional regulator [Paenisporosarcina cavernae]AYC28504.1 TetR/AcrR family transcriptional regulator [Paenisporosarcina cavernae]